MNPRRTGFLLVLVGIVGIALGAEGPEKPRVFNPDTFGFLTLLGEEQVREKLQLNADQLAAIDGILAEWQKAYQQANETASGDGEASRALAQSLEAHERKALDLLNPDQRKQVARLHRLKRAGQFKPTNAIGTKEEELHLTEAQRVAIAEVDAAWITECERLDGEHLEDLDKHFWQQEFTKQILKQHGRFEAQLNVRLEEVLQPAQWRRYIELRWQDEAQRDGPAILLRPELSQTLRQTQAQEEHLQGIVTATRQDAAAQFEKGEHFAAMRTRLAKLREGIGSLEPEQQRQAEAILGEPHGWFKDLWEGRDPQPRVEAQ